MIFKKHCGTFLLIAEICVIVGAILVGLVPTNMQTATTIIIFIMTVVAICCFGEEVAKTETTNNTDVLE